MKQLKLVLLFCTIFFVPDIFSQSLYYDNGRGELRLQNPPPITSQSGQAKWSYFWEFGDGHFTMTEKPKVKYLYKKAGNYKAKVFLSALYSVTVKDQSFSTPVSVSRTGGEEVKYKPEYFFIETDSRNELIPDRTIRVALHYKVPGRTSFDGGYMLFYYNKDEELNVSYDPLEYAPGKESFYNKEKIVDLTEPLTTLPANIVRQIKLKNNEFNEVKVYKVPKQKRGSRIFLDLKSNPELTEFTGREDSKITLFAHWVPLGNDGAKIFDASYEFKILAVHDPNKITVRPRKQFYRKRKPERLVYKIKFQNEEKGIVRNARVATYVGKNLDKKTLKILEIGPGKWKKYTHEAQKSRGDRCYRVETNSHPDSIVFHFYNIELMGSKVFNRKDSKAFIRYTLDTNDKRVTYTKSTADIYFSGAEEKEPTGVAKTKWKEKGVFIDAGYINLMGAGAFADNSDKITEKMAAGISFQNAPVGRGFSWGIDGNWAAFRLKRDASLNIVNNVVPDGGQLIQSEDVKINLIEVKGKVGYQVNRWIKAFTSGGITIPALADLDVEAEVRYNINAEPIIADQINTAFGLFNARADESIFNRDITTRSNMGFIGNVGLELGDLNRFSIGVKYEYRFYPKAFYLEETCFSMDNIQATLRFKLFTL